MTDAILSQRSLFAGWLEFVLLTMRLNNEVVERGAVLHPSGSSVLAYDPDRRVAITTRQTRAGVLMLGAPVLAEAIGGATEKEQPVETARREAFEEAGLELGVIESVGFVWMTPSTTTERVHLFLAEYRVADRRYPGGGAPGENEVIEVFEEPLIGLWSAIERGDLVDAKLFMLLQALRLSHPDLFRLP